MKLSDIKGEEAFDVLADIVDPIAKIAADKQVRKEYASSKPKLYVVKYIVKNHSKELIEILARLNLKTVEEYRETLNLVSLPLELMELLNDPDILAIFQSQSQAEETSSGSVTENTEALEE